MATWEDVSEAVLGSYVLRQRMFDYLWENDKMGNFNEEDARWFFEASMGKAYIPGTGHRQNRQILCEQFLPKYESILKQQNQGEDDEAAAPTV